MAEEPQPSGVHEGAKTPAPPTGNAEDRKAAAALDKLDNRADDDENGNAKGVDTEALGKAMKNLDVKEKTETKKAVKVEAADINLVVDQLELTKAKATELLKAHDGDAVKAMTAYVTASA